MNGLLAEAGVLTLLGGRMNKLWICSLKTLLSLRLIYAVKFDDTSHGLVR